MAKIITAKEAAALIKNDVTIGSGGFMGGGFAEEIVIELENRFIETKEPTGLTLVFPAGQGNGGERGNNHYGHEKMIKRVIGGHFALSPKLSKLALENKIEAYNLPQGVISQFFREIAAKRPGLYTHVGLHTFVDPRVEGGKINSVTTEDLVSVEEIEGKEYLKYKLFGIDCAIMRGTSADEKGNVTLEHECNTLEATSLAMACKNSGGIVIVQVERLVEHGTLNPKLVKIPGVLVDYIVVASDPKYHTQTFGYQFKPEICGETRLPVSAIPPLPLDERKIIARRAFMELEEDSIVNLGIGLPEGIAAVATEEGKIHSVTFTVEAGAFGGMPASGLNFGAVINADAMVDQPNIFDFYQGGGINQAFLGLAQVDSTGNLNVSRFGPRLAGCGGFVDITQNTKRVCFIGAMTAGDLQVAIVDGKLKIIKEGPIKKFLKNVEQITFSSRYAQMTGQKIKYITERCVFELTPEGLTLIEVADGIDIKTQILDQMEFAPIISKDLKIMDPIIFSAGAMRDVKNK